MKLISHINGRNILRVSENMVLERIFGNRREEVTGRWREFRWPS
jgi:hypothetical protein